MKKKQKAGKTMSNSVKAAVTATGFLIAHYVYISICSFMKFGKDTDIESYFYAGMIYLFLSGVFVWLLNRARTENSYKIFRTIFMLYVFQRLYSFHSLLSDLEVGSFQVQVCIALPIAIFIFRGMMDLKNGKKNENLAH